MENKNTEITRKEAIKKMGKYAAFTAIGTFAVLNPLQAQNTSDPQGVVHHPINNPPSTTQTNSAIESQVGKTQVQSNF